MIFKIVLRCPAENGNEKQSRGQKYPSLPNANPFELHAGVHKSNNNNTADALVPIKRRQLTTKIHRVVRSYTHKTAIKTKVLHVYIKEQRCHFFKIRFWRFNKKKKKPWRVKFKKKLEAIISLLLLRVLYKSPSAGNK